MSFFISYILKYGNEDPYVKKQLSNVLKNFTNWLYTTAGYYDKTKFERDNLKSFSPYKMLNRIGCYTLLNELFF